MKAKRTDDLHGCPKRARRQWIALLGIGLAALSGFLFQTPAQAAAPVSLTLKGQWSTPAWGWGVAVQGQYAYVADLWKDLHVIDVSDPANPVRVGGYGTNGSVWSVAVAGNYVYVAEAQRWTGSNYVGGGLQVIDVSDPANPVRVGGYDSSGWFSQSVAVAGNYAYMAVWGAGLQVIDVSNPADPVRVGGYDTSGYASDVAVAGNYAYVAGVYGLQVIDVSNPADPVRVGSYDTNGNAESVAVAGNYAYVADGLAGLQVIDVSNPANPGRVGGIDIEYAYDVAVAGNYAYVADGGEGFLDLPGQGLVVIDMSNPANPVRVGSYAASEYASDVAVMGDLIYVADERWGLLILEQSLAPPPPAEWVRVQTDPASTPRARHNHAMVFDEVREVILMHGGRLQDSTVLSDTWQWDGQSWMQLATNGPKVFQQSMAYDPSRGVTVLYGGRTCAGHSCPIGDTWEWDGQSWNLIEVGPTNPPPPVMGGMAYDPIRQKVVRQGGITAPDDTFDVGATWEWDGQTWTQIADGFLRGGHSLVFDPVRGRMIAFGGSSIGNTSPSPGTWEFDGNEWNLITTEGPSARFTFDRALVWDVYRNVGVLYGGAASASIPFEDTWEWDGVQWKQVTIPGPGPRGMHAMAYDAKRRKVVLFGGYRDCFRCEINETWEYRLLPLQLTSLERQSDGSLEIQWAGEAPPYQLQSRTNLSAGDWQNVGAPTVQLSATVPGDSPSRFFRVLSQ